MTSLPRLPQRFKGAGAAASPARAALAPLDAVSSSRDEKLKSLERAQAMLRGLGISFRDLGERIDLDRLLQPPAELESSAPLDLEHLLLLQRHHLTEDQRRIVEDLVRRLAGGGTLGIPDYRAVADIRARLRVARSGEAPR